MIFKNALSLRFLRLSFGNRTSHKAMQSGDVESNSVKIKSLIARFLTYQSLYGSQSIAKIGNPPPFFLKYFFV